MLESRNYNQSILDKMFAANPDSNTFLSEQIKETAAMLKKIDKELSDALVNNIDLLQRLSAFNSLPVADRYRLVPLKAVHDKDCSILRILFDDLGEMLSLTTDTSTRSTISHLRADCFNLLATATQTVTLLENGIQGKSTDQPEQTAEIVF